MDASADTVLADIASELERMEKEEPEKYLKLLEELESMLNTLAEK